MDSASVLITGGGLKAPSTQVARYDAEGFVGDLPSLQVGRKSHGCGSFLREGGIQVSKDLPDII